MKIVMSLIPDYTYLQLYLIIYELPLWEICKDIESYYFIIRHTDDIPLNDMELCFHCINVKET